MLVLVGRRRKKYNIIDATQRRRRVSNHSIEWIDHQVVQAEGSIDDTGINADDIDKKEELLIQLHEKEEDPTIQINTPQSHEGSSRIPLKDQVFHSNKKPSQCQYNDNTFTAGTISGYSAKELIIPKES